MLDEFCKKQAKTVSLRSSRWVIHRPNPKAQGGGPVYLQLGEIMEPISNTSEQLAAGVWHRARDMDANPS